MAWRSCSVNLRAASATKTQQVALLERVAHRIHEALVELRVGLVDAGRIDKNDLRLGSVTTPWIDVRVVCGLSATMATFWPTRAFSSVDLPAFGPADDGDEARLELAGSVSIHVRVIERPLETC